VLPETADFKMVYTAVYNGDEFGKGSGHFAITFMNVADAQQARFESFTLEGFMPLTGDATAGSVTLASGRYTYESNEGFSGAPFTFLSYYGEVRNLGTYYMSTLYGTTPERQLFYPVGGGTVTVGDAGYGNTEIAADVVDDKGRAMKITFTGPLSLDNTTVEKEVAYNPLFVSVRSAQNVGQYFEQPIREFELAFAQSSKFGNDNVSESMNLRFNADLKASADGDLPSGRYFPFTTEKYAKRAPFTYVRGGSAHGITSGSYYSRQSTLYGSDVNVLFDLDGGYIDVDNRGDGTYAIRVRAIGTEVDNVNMTTSPGAIVSSDFTGPISFKGR
jgi:hypothetical protein